MVRKLPRPYHVCVFKIYELLLFLRLRPHDAIFMRLIACDMGLAVSHVRFSEVDLVQLFMRCRMEKCNILLFFSSSILVHLIFKEISTSTSDIA